MPKKSKDGKKSTRAYGDGTVFKTKDGRWRATVEFGIGRDGRRVRRYASGTTKTEVERKVQALRDERAGGKPVASRNRRRTELTLEQWLDRWLDSVRDDLAEDTHDRYAGLVRNQLKPTLGAMYLTDIKPSDVRLALAAIRRMPKRDTSGRPMSGQRLSESTVRQSYAVLRRALKAAVADELVQSNSAAAVDAPTVDRDKQLGVKAFDQDDARRLLTVAAETSMPARWYLALVTGARQSECLGLTWDTINLDTGVLSIVQQLKQRGWEHGCTADDPCAARAAGCPTARSCPGDATCPHTWHRARNRPCPSATAHPSCEGRDVCVFSARKCDRRQGGGFYIKATKTKRHRTMTLPQFLVTELRAQKERQDDLRAAAGSSWEQRHDFRYLVFTGVDGKPLDHKRDRANWLALLAAAGLDETRLHNARHTAATILTDLGYDTAVIQTILGQSMVATTRLYQQTSAATTAAAAAALDELYGSAS